MLLAPLVGLLLAVALAVLWLLGGSAAGRLVRTLRGSGLRRWSPRSRWSACSRC